MHTCKSKCGVFMCRSVTQCVYLCARVLHSVCVCLQHVFTCGNSFFYVISHRHMLPYTHTHTHTRAHTHHTHTHKHTHSHTHTHIRTTHTNTHKCGHVRAQQHAHTHKHSLWLSHVAPS